MNMALRLWRFVRTRLSVPLIVCGLSVPPVAVPLSAQDSPVNVGVKGGLNLSQFYGAEIGNSETLQAPVIGVFAQFDIGGGFSVQPEISYSKRGAREEDLLEAASDGVWHYNYFDAVALLRFRVTAGRSSPSFSLFSGPVLSILGSSKATGQQPEELHAECAGCARELISFRYVRLLQHNTKGKDFGGTVGMAIDFDTGPANLVLDVRYTKMMSEFDKAPYDDLYFRKHSALTFQAGFSLNQSALGGGRVRSGALVDDPGRHSIVTLDVIEREDIAARDRHFPCTTSSVWNGRSGWRAMRSEAPSSWMESRGRVHPKSCETASDQRWRRLSEWSGLQAHARGTAWWSK